MLLAAVFAVGALSGCGRDRPKLEPIGDVHQVGRFEVGHAAVFGVAAFRVDRPATVRSIRVLHPDGATVLSADLIIGYSGYQCYPDGPSAVERRGRTGV